MHVVDVSSVFDCAHSSITSTITSKHTNATKTTKRGRKSTSNKINRTNGSRSGQRALPKSNNDQCKKELPKSNGVTPTKKTTLNDELTGPTNGNVWTHVVQIVHDSQNIVMMAVLLVLIYLFCYDRTVRS